jgi:hypothetical protein
MFSVTGCGGGGDANLPTPTVPMVTINVTSMPAGAVVAVGTTNLGPTPITARQYPLPFTPGQPLSFSLTLAGHQPLTTTAVPQNGQVNVNASLAPIVVVAPPSGGNGSDIVVRGNGGGRIRDHSSVSASAVVTNNCTVSSMRVQLRGRHTHHGDLRATIRLPNGQNRSFARGRGRRSGFFGSRHRVRNVSGIPAAGAYRVTISDRVSQDYGRMTGFTLSIACQ